MSRFLHLPHRDGEFDSLSPAAIPGKLALLWVLMLVQACTLWPRSAEAFDADRAMADLKAQCEFGPRVPGTEAHVQCRDWIEQQMTDAGLTVRREEFQAYLKLTGQSVTAWNLWGTTGETPASPTLVLSAHWDCRPRSDQGDSPRQPVMGANDAASGVAVALELYRQLKPTKWGPHIVLAFWDAEDSGVSGDNRSWCLGSAHAAENPPPWIDQMTLGINLDMVAGEDMVLYPERYSVRAAPQAVARIWQIGMAMTPHRFAMGQSQQIVDDHWSWIRIRDARYIDLIGLPYEHWHTENDVPENCSTDSMQAVGDTLLNYIVSGHWTKTGTNPASNHNH